MSRLMASERARAFLTTELLLARLPAARRATVLVQQLASWPERTLERRQQG